MSPKNDYAATVIPFQRYHERVKNKRYGYKMAQVMQSVLARHSSDRETTGVYSTQRLSNQVNQINFT